MLLNQGREALRECESRLRRLLAEAASLGDYEAVPQLTEWARGVAGLASASPPATGGWWKCAFMEQHEENGSGLVSSNGQTRAKSPTQRRKKTRTQRTRRTRKLSAAVYPKFARFRDELVKIGWSKKDKKEYQHKAPRRVVDSLVDRLIEVAAAEELFSTDQLFPLRDKDGDSEIPSYQAYLCLAWLREQNLIEQVGRQGYRLLDPCGLRSSVEQRWAHLPSLVELQ